MALDLKSSSQKNRQRRYQKHHAGRKVDATGATAEPSIVDYASWIYRLESEIPEFAEIRRRQYSRENISREELLSCFDLIDKKMKYWDC